VSEGNFCLPNGWGKRALQQFLNVLKRCPVDFTQLIVNLTVLLRFSFSRSKWNIRRQVVTIAGSIYCITPVYTHIFFQHILPCPRWSSNSPPATFWDPFQSQTSWSGCWESQNVTNESSSSGRYYVAQCQLSRSWHHFVICNVVAPRNAQNAPETSTMENVSHLGNFIGCFPRFTGINPCWNYNGRVQTYGNLTVSWLNETTNVPVVISVSVIVIQAKASVPVMLDLMEALLASLQQMGRLDDRPCKFRVTGSAGNLYYSHSGNFQRLLCGEFLGIPFNLQSAGK